MSIFLEGRTFSEENFFTNNNGELALLNTGYCTVFIDKQTGTDKTSFEYWFGDGSTTPQVILDGTPGWAFSKGTVNIPMNYKFILKANPSDGTTDHYLYTTNGVKAYSLKYPIKILAGNFFVFGQGIDKTVLRIENTSSVVFTTNFRIKKSSCSNSAGSETITVPDTTDLYPGQAVYYEIGDIATITSSSFKYHKEQHFFLINELTSGTTITVSGRVDAAYSGKDLYVLSENIVLSDLTIDGRSGILGGTRTGKLGNIYYSSQVDLSRCRLINFRVDGAGTIDAKACLDLKARIEHCGGRSTLRMDSCHRAEIFGKHLRPTQTTGSGYAVQDISGFRNKIYIEDSRVEGGSGYAYGGGIGSLYSANCFYKSVDCYVEGDGGGMYIEFGGGYHILEMQNCEATYNGGGAYLSDGTVFCLIRAQKCVAGGNGGGVYLEAGANTNHICEDIWQFNNAFITGPNIYCGAGASWMFHGIYEVSSTYTPKMDTSWQIGNL